MHHYQGDFHEDHVKIMSVKETYFESVIALFGIISLQSLHSVCSSYVTTCLY